MYKIKVCGMRDIENIEALLKLDIHFMGFIFFEKSTRHIDATAEKILQKALLSLDFTNWKRTVAKVGVFVDAPMEYVLEKVNNLQLDYVQLHGQESIFYCQKLQEKGIKIIKAFSIDESFCFTQTDFYKFYCDYFLFDTKGKKPGGNGTQFNWDLLQEYKGDTPFFLSGGIGEMDTAAISQFQHSLCFAVDVNSGFELASALKDVDSLQRFSDVLSKNSNLDTDW